MCIIFRVESFHCLFLSLSLMPSNTIEYYAIKVSDVRRMHESPNIVERFSCAITNDENENRSLTYASFRIKLNVSFRVIIAQKPMKYFSDVVLFKFRIDLNDLVQ